MQTPQNGGDLHRPIKSTR